MKITWFSLEHQWSSLTQFPMCIRATEKFPQWTVWAQCILYSNMFRRCTHLSMHPWKTPAVKLNIYAWIVDSSLSSFSCGCEIDLLFFNSSLYICIDAFSIHYSAHIKLVEAFKFNRTRNISSAIFLRFTFVCVVSMQTISVHNTHNTYDDSH